MKIIVDPNLYGMNFLMWVELFILGYITGVILLWFFLIPNLLIVILGEPPK